MIFTFAGTGTSHGVPVIGCGCCVCASRQKKDKRLRSSAFVEEADTCVCIDTGPEFRIQALNYGLKKLNAVLLTHSHADHLHGLDDVRIFSAQEPIPVYGNTQTLEDVHNRFDYIFKTTQTGGGKPHLDLIDCTPYNYCNPLQIGSLTIIPIPLLHGHLHVSGWRIGKIAYLTDVSKIPETSFQLLSGLEHLVIDALRRRPHSTHLNFVQAFELAEKIGARQTWLTHICHDFSHKEICVMTRGKTILPAYDGLQLTV